MNVFINLNRKQQKRTMRYFDINRGVGGWRGDGAVEGRFIHRYAPEKSASSPLKQWAGALDSRGQSTFTSSSSPALLHSTIDFLIR